MVDSVTTNLYHHFRSGYKIKSGSGLGMRLQMLMLHFSLLFPSPLQSDRAMLMM